MITTKTVIATIVLLGSATLAQAQGFDPNLANRYPSYAEPGAYGYSSNGGAPAPTAARSLQSRDVSLPRHEAPRANEAWMDRASQSFGGGGF
jgi:hypothetical protein